MLFFNSERHLTDALLIWLGGNIEHITRDDWIEILQQVIEKLIFQG